MYNIPVHTQLVRARPVLERMVELRCGRALPEEYQHASSSQCEKLSSPIFAEYIPPCDHPVFPFCENVRADDISHVREHYPRLYAHVSAADADNVVAVMDRLADYMPVYRACAMQRLAVDFSQCIEENPTLIWMPTQRDARFQQELSKLTRAIDERARQCVSEFSISATPAVLEECMQLFCSNYTHVYLYITRNTKASETLDKKFDKMCSDARASHGITVQLFNLKSVMFNVTEHVLVPRHERLIARVHAAEIKAIMERYNISSIYEFPCISNADPAGRFIGLQEHDICKITRSNKTSGDFVFYRRCVHEALQ